MFNSTKRTIKTVSFQIKIGETISTKDLCINPRFSNPQLTKLQLSKLRLLKTQGDSKEDFSAYVKANDAVMRNMQTQAPTEGYENAIIVPLITDDNFELKHGLLTLVQNNNFFGHDKEDPYAHVRYFNKITSTLKFPNVSNTTTEGYEDAIVVPAITADNFELNEAWDRFKDLLRACPHHGFSKLHQPDTFYNALNSKDQDSLNSTAGGMFLDKMPRECLAIIESKSKVRYSHNKPVVAKVSTNTSTARISPDVAELKDMVKA
nr:hypothetical protein [Tanacetum cinerariifolium]